MKSNVFAIYMLSICLGMTYFYSVIKNHYSGRRTVELKYQKLNKSYEAEKLKTYLLRSDYREFKQTVAQYLPEAMRARGKKPESGYPLRNLASLTMRFPPLEIGESPSQRLMRKGKESFNIGRYGLAKNYFQSVVNLHDGSIHTIEAHFLSAESSFQEGKYEDCIEIVNKMVRHYPEHELTGYVLLRLGAILEIQERSQEAAKIYRTILKQFKNNELLIEAQGLLAKVEA